MRDKVLGSDISKKTFQHSFDIQNHVNIPHTKNNIKVIQNAGESKGYANSNK